MRLLLQQRMHDGTVQAFRVSLDDQLPICFQVVNAAFDHLKFGHAPRLKLAVESGKMLLKRNWARRKIDENMPVPNRRGNCVERIVGLMEALYFFHMRRISQRAIEFVSPCVILALNASGELAFLLLA